MSHYPFDHGTLDTLSALAGQKTIKSICGRRVAFQAARIGAPVTCPACRERMALEAVDAAHTWQQFTKEAPALATAALQRAKALTAVLERKAPAYQDGAQFYDATEGACIASYPHLVRGDYDMPGAIAARAQFVRDFPQYVVE